LNIKDKTEKVKNYLEIFNIKQFYENHKYINDEYINKRLLNKLIKDISEDLELI
jgi:hypothetical protein